MCDFLSEGECVYLFLPAKVNVGHLCEKLKIGMRSGWGQRCDDNFLTIYVGTVLGEKPDFTGKFFER